MDENRAKFLSELPEQLRSPYIYVFNCFDELCKNTQPPWPYLLSIIQDYREDSDPDDLYNDYQEYLDGSDREYNLLHFQIIKYISSFETVKQSHLKVPHLKYLDDFIKYMVEKTKEQISETQNTTAHQDILRKQTAIITALIHKNAEAAITISEALKRWPCRLGSEIGVPVYTGFNFEIPDLVNIEYNKSCIESIKQCMPGDNISFPFVVSTTISKEVVQGFLGNMDTMLTIIIPPDYPFTFISKTGKELEVLLDANSVLEYTGIHDMVGSNENYTFNLKPPVAAIDPSIITKNVAEIIALLNTQFNEMMKENSGGKKLNYKKNKKQKKKTRKTKKTRKIKKTRKTKKTKFL